MERDVLPKLTGFLAALGLDEEPLGLFFSNQEPKQGFAPQAMALPTVEKEAQGTVDWPEVFGKFSCALGHIWRARKKKTAAYFSAERFGCMGAAFWMGFNKPQTETIIQYVSSGVPGWAEGERYCESPDALREAFRRADPPAAPGRFCVIKPLSLFGSGESPAQVIFLARSEALCGLHQLAFFITNDLQAVASPWSASCGSLVAWPLYYAAKGRNKAVLGGWDPSARKFFKNDELSFTVPFPMLLAMLERYRESFLSGKEWAIVRKKIERSKKTWGEPH